MITVATMGGAMAAAGTLASHSAQREKEAELLFVGEQYRHAIQTYYERSPGGAKRYPQKLEDMLEDKRFPTMQRHLRKLYPDPVTGKEIGIIDAPGGGIMGVFSRSEAAPVKTGNFRKRDEGLADKEKYADWQFFYLPASAGQANSPAGAQPNSPTGLPASQPGNNTGNTLR